MNKVFSRILASGASLAALGAHAAYAQEAEQPQAAVSDEIVVTATGRQAAVQDVAIAVTALNAETLQNAGVQTIRGLEQLTPSMRITVGQSTTEGTVVQIRGISTGGDNPGFEPAVGIFIDGVYRSRAGIAMGDLPELERIEVLRGPQGTLFGRNTSAGAISIATQAPDYYNSMWMEGTFGEYNLTEAKAGVNLPIVTDVLAARLEGSIRSRDGYLSDTISDDTINNLDRWSARGQILWDITPDASFRVIVDGGQTDEICCGAVTITPGYGPDLIAGTPDDNTFRLEDRMMAVTPGRMYSEAVDEWGVSGELNWDIGGVKLTSITAYRDWEATRRQDTDFGLADISYRDGQVNAFQTFTEEVRLNGQAGPLDWLVGVFYGNETLDRFDTLSGGASRAAYLNAAIGQGTAATSLGQLFPTGCGVYASSARPSLFYCATFASAFQQALQGGATLGQAQAIAAGAAAPLAAAYLPAPVAGDGQRDRWQVESTSYSFFTHNEISITDQLILTLGARYNIEEKDLTANLSAVFPGCDALRFLESTTDALTPTPGGIVTAVYFGGAQTPLLGACNPAVNTVANGAYADSNEENEFNGTASLAYHATDDLMVYGGYSRGYKAGGYNVDRFAFDARPQDLVKPNITATRFRPEFVDAFELGMKSTLFNGAAIFNVAAFYELFHDYQLNSFSGFSFITRNIDETVSRGIEVDFQARPTDNLTFQGGVTWNEAFYDSTVNFRDRPGESDPRYIIQKGSPVSQAPKWAVVGGVTYTQPLMENLQAVFYLDGRWNSAYRTADLNRDPATDQEAYGVINSRVALGHPDGNLSLELWGRNLLDELYYVDSFGAPEQVATMIYPSEPRTWGVTLRARF